MASMKIGELAAAAEVAPSAIRFYEKSGLLPSAPRTASGYRLYGADALMRVRVIQLAQRLGFSLETIRAVFQPKGNRVGAGVQGFNRTDLLARLDERAAQIDGMIAELKARKSELTQLRGTLTDTWSRGACADPLALPGMAAVGENRAPASLPKSNRSGMRPSKKAPQRA